MTSPVFLDSYQLGTWKIESGPQHCNIKILKIGLRTKQWHISANAVHQDLNARRKINNFNIQHSFKSRKLSVETLMKEKDAEV